MAYIGNPILTTDYPVNTFSGNGSTTAFTLSLAPASVNSILVAVSGVIQDPSTYTVSGTTLTFTAAPPSGTSNISVRHLGIAGIPNTPSAGSVITASIADANITQAKLASGVAGTGPAFSAYKSNSSGTQTITTNVYTKVTFDTEDFDTNNNFASSRFTPTVAGYYQINAEIDMGGSGLMIIGIFKNGSEFKRGSGVTAGMSEAYCTVASLIDMNGTTDYLEIYALSQGGTGSIYASAVGLYAWFNGCLVRSA